MPLERQKKLCKQNSTARASNFYGVLRSIFIIGKNNWRGANVIGHCSKLKFN